MKTHHWSGINLLGVLLLLIGAIGLWGGIELGARLEHRTMTLVCLAVGVGSAGILDLLWRLSRVQGSRTYRLFHPLEGGCILYLPIWLYILGGAVIVGILAANRGA